MSTNMDIKSKMYYIHSLIGIACMILFRFIPTFATFTKVGMEVLGIFIGTLYCWIATNSITWPSILGLTFLGMGSFYGGSFTKAMTASVTNTSMQMLVLSLSIFSLLSITKVADQIANRVISSKLIKGRPWALSIALIMIAYVCAMLKSPYIAIYICWEFVYTICHQTGYTKDDRWTKMMICGIPFATTIGMVTLPFSISALAGFGFLSSLSENKYTFNAMLYTGFAMVFGLVIMAVYFMLCRILLRPDMSKLKGVDLSVKIEPYTSEQKFALFVVCLYVFLAIAPAILPAEWYIAQRFANLTLVGVASLVLAVVLFPRNKQGRDLYNFGDLCKAANVWNLIVMVTVAATMGSALSDKSVGFIDLFNKILGVMFVGRGPYFLALVACVAACVLTNIISNAVTLALMLPLSYAFAASMGVSPIPAALMVIFSAATGYLLPSSSTAGAILNSNVDWIKPKDIITYGGVGLVAFLLAAAVFGIPYANLIY